jgi:plasmid stabilization system protein ParE
MHNFHFKPEANENLADLGASDDEIDMIRAAVKELAANPEAGNPVKFIYDEEKLFQYPVGRYWLYYTFTNGHLRVESVLLESVMR